MKRIPLFSLFALGVAGAALALSESATAIDTNGDGVLTLDEVQAVYPDISTAMFSAMDIDADGTLNSEEVTAAEDAGVMPTGS